MNVSKMVVDADDTPDSGPEARVANATARNPVAGPSSNEHGEHKKQGKHKSIETGIPLARFS